MSKRYLLFASLPYAFSIMRPLQEEIRKRGGEVAWYLEDSCADLLDDSEVRLHTVDEAISFNPIAIFTPGNHIYDFFPGVKVAVFHGYPIAKRGELNSEKDDHFNIRGWFDIYCTQGPSSTEPFKRLEKRLKHFKVYETGWSKVDPFFSQPSFTRANNKPTVLYATTFTKGISSAPVIFDTIAGLVERRDWNWILTFHPKIQDQELLGKFRALAADNDNVTFEANVRLENFQQADVMLSDSSSIILEFMLFDKPVVTYRNTNPGPHLLNSTELNEVEGNIEYALSRPETLMEQVRQYSLFNEAHRDGNNCGRILDAVDDFIDHYQGRIASKPLNLIRKIKQRVKAGYWKLR